MARPKEPWKRDRILATAVEQAQRIGASNLTIRDVAEAANVSTATVHYHFDDIGGLIFGVLDRSMTEMYSSRKEKISGLNGAIDKLRVLVELGVPDEVSPDVHFMYEAIPVVISRPEYQTVAHTFTQSQVGLYEAVIHEGVAEGVFHPIDAAHSIAQNFVALEDAYDLYRVLGFVDDGEEGRKNIMNYAKATLGHPGADLW